MGMDRSQLVSLIDDAVKAGADCPVLVVEGSGGSGRSTLLSSRWSKWAGRTPTAWVNPRLLGATDDGDLRPVLLAVMLGLMSTEVPNYHVKFRRVLAACVAMDQPITDGNPRPAATMRERLIRYQDPDNLIGLVRPLLRITGQAVRAVQAPGGEVVAAISDAVAPVVVNRLRRSPWIAKLTWGKAPEWFGHQDIGRKWDGYEALVLLSRLAQNETYAVRRDVGELLVRALLADLRESLDSIKNRRWNALVLLDNGDLLMASAFTSALIRVRDRVGDPASGPRTRPADPLVLVTASGGALASNLGEPEPETSTLDGSRSGNGAVADARRVGAWRRLPLSDFTEAQVKAMAEERMWASELGTDTVAYLVHRLTGGHAEATSLVFKALDTDSRCIVDLGRVLRNTALVPADKEDQSPPTLAQHLLNKIVTGLRPSGRVDRWLRHDLVTLSAARNRAEAESLAGLVRVSNLKLLRTSATLWSNHGRALPPLTTPKPAPPPVLPPLVRWLSLRALADRDEAGTPPWTAVFETLREAVEEDDRAGLLHHELALGNTTSVVRDLVDLLPKRPAREWLALLDEITGTPDPRMVFTIEDNAPLSTERADVVATIVEGQRAAGNPELSDQTVLADLYQRLGDDFAELAGTRSGAFADRAEHYRELAERLGGTGHGRPHRTD